MKSLLLLSLLGLGAVGCQPQSTAHNASASLPVAQTAVVKRNPAVAQAVDTLPPSPELELPVRFGKVLRTNIQSQPITDAQQIQTFFNAQNLASLLQTVHSRTDGYALNGFRGADQYRTEVVVLTARRSSQQASWYEITGLTRTRKRISHFIGQIQFDSVAREPMLTAADLHDIQEWSMAVPIWPGDEPVQRFAVMGRASLQERKTVPEASYFQGRMVLEFALTKNGHLTTNAPFIHGPSQGGKQRYAGTWTTYATGQATPSVWVEDYSGDALFVQQEFLLGEREETINPAYAKKGWNKLWENDEWWANAPKSKLAL